MIRKFFSCTIDYTLMTCTLYVYMWSWYFSNENKKKVIFFDFVLGREGWDEDDGKHVKWEMRNERINMECKCHL